MDEDGRLTASTLLVVSGEFDILSIHTISLAKRGLSDVSSISECTTLERLDLSFNDITRLHALSALVNLIVLDLSGNSITTLDGLQSLENLEKLNLSGNLIGSCDSLRCLSRLEKLYDLRLRDPNDRSLSNPVCMNVSYKRDVQALLSRLKVLDGEWLVGAGGQLFQLFDELDKSLSDFKSATPDGPFKAPNMPPPLPPTNTPMQRTGDDSIACEAERQFRASLAQCDKLNQETTQLMQDIYSKLHVPQNTFTTR